MSFPLAYSDSNYNRSQELCEACDVITKPDCYQCINHVAMG